MALLEKIRKNVSGTFNGKGMALGAALMGATTALAPMTANAADGRPQYDDVRLENAERQALSGPAASGKNRIALKLLGGTDELTHALWSIAPDIEKETDRDVWLIRAADDNPNDNKTKLEIYVSGRKTGTLSLDDFYLIKERLTASVKDGINIMNARDTASLDQPIPVADGS